MHQYSARDVERLVHLPRSRIRSFVEAGFVSPARGPRNAWLFSFQDLIVLRTAQALAAAKVPHKRIARSVKELLHGTGDALVGDLGRGERLGRAQDDQILEGEQPGVARTARG